MCTLRRAECSHTNIKPQTHTPSGESNSANTSLCFLVGFSQRKRRRAAGRGVCEAEWRSVEQAYQAQHRHWDDLLAVSDVRAQWEHLCHPGRGQAAFVPQQLPSQSFIYQVKSRAIYLDCVCAEACRRLTVHRSSFTSIESSESTVHVPLQETGSTKAMQGNNKRWYVVIRYIWTSVKINEQWSDSGSHYHNIYTSLFMGNSWAEISMRSQNKSRSRKVGHIM